MTLREVLRETVPVDFSLKLAWRQLIRALRARKRGGAEPSRFGSRAALEQALDTSLQSSLEQGDSAFLELKQALRDLVVAPGSSGPRGAPPDPSSPESLVLAERIDELLQAVLPMPVEGPVMVSVRGWPSGFGPAQRARLLRRDRDGPVECSPLEAAAVVREWDGFVLGGSALSVRVALPSGAVLPPVPRNLRARPTIRDQRSTWLPFVDEEGQRTLTPRTLADRYAQRVPTTQVIDGCCGCGGNAIAFASAGLEVIAVEIVPSRLDLARRNARQLGVADRIRFVEGDLTTVLPGLLANWPDATVFVDPPWAESLVDERSPSWLELLPGGPGLAELLSGDLPVLAKLPRSFDLSSLPGDSWEVAYEFGEGSMASVVRMLSALKPGLPGTAR